ncbi:MAG: hypothetical protein ACN6OB_21915 [Chryseobacterium jejuense]|uniref:hypothetical protein n=1 Tax=Chryseobacterium jejuense TaxID=445960 RepID=UPI003D152749
MKEFAKNDYYIQTFFVIVGIAASAIGFQTWAVLAFYFIAGVSQLISFLLRLFINKRKSTLYIVYGITILPVWISLLVIILLKQNNDLTDFFGFILFSALFYSPVMALLYVYDTYNQYKNLNIIIDESIDL